MLERRSALILNYTGNGYHWGCHATAREIYDTLVERGYCVNWIGVSVTHGFQPTPERLGDFDDDAFVQRAFDAAPAVADALDEADVIVANGEGTLHRLHQGPRNLLFLMYAARKYLGKPVHLINHSFFPSGGMEPAEPADTLYGGVARALHRVVPREAWSAAVLARLGVAAEQGFDCLPRFAARHGFGPVDGAGGPLLLAGGVTLPEPMARRIARVVGRFAGPGRPVRFLTGAKARPAAEDPACFAWMREELPALELATAASAGDWLGAIGGAACLVSGRFHHTLAAVALGRPVVAFPSNTPKTEAACATLGLEAPVRFDDPCFEEALERRVRRALDGAAPRLDGAGRRRMLALAEANFTGL